MKASKPLTPAAILAVPALLAVLTAGGLAAALFGDDVFDAMSWVALLVPLLVATYFARTALRS